MTAIEDRSEETFFVVGLGASAGGLEALKAFFKHMPENSGCAFVVIQHLSPDYKSMMAELLGRCTPMKVQQVEDDMPLLPNHVYLIPPQYNLTLRGRKLKLEAHQNPKTLNLPIDIFFRSLAEEFGERAVAVVLSGTGSDGTRGVRAVKEQGGLVAVQEKESAKFDGMPHNAMHTGLADFILPPEEMPEKLMAYIRHPNIAGSGRGGITEETVPEHLLDDICGLIRQSNNIDFQQYKPSTISRRIRRRMGINQIENTRAYLDYLSSSRREVDALVKDFLIAVTKFFRDRDCFMRLKEQLRTLFENSEDGCVRLWSVGCATGEEVYSLAMMAELFRRQHFPQLRIKVFGTDADKEVLNFASRGVYPKSVTEDIPAEYMEQFMEPQGDASFRVRRELRDRVVFARQDILKDPPFTQMDLVSCRNVLIYLKQPAQKLVIERLQFALRPGGLLFLGSSESLPPSLQGFNVLNVADRLYQRTSTRTPRLNQTFLAATRSSQIESNGPNDPGSLNMAQRQKNQDLMIYQRIIEDTGAAGLVVSEQGDLLFSAGAVDRYLEIKPGPARLNVTKMAGDQLGVALNAAIGQAFRDRKPIHFSGVQRPDHKSGKTSRVDIDVRFLSAALMDQPTALVSIRPAAGLAGHSEGDPDDLSESIRQRIRDLENELSETRENLASSLEEQEASNEELQASNEELLAANEELQSTNEELESVNEELHTVNTEHQQKIVDMAELTEDLENLLRGSSIGTCFLDEEKCIRYLTPVFLEISGLREQDTGRRLSEFSNSFVQELSQLVEQVSQAGRLREKVIQADDNKTFLVRVQPYQKSRGDSEAVMISCIDITKLEKTRTELEKIEHVALAEKQLKESIMDALPAHVALVDEKGIILKVNRAWREFGQREGLEESDGNEGANYLEVCRVAAEKGGENAHLVYAALRDVLKGEKEFFELDYPCHGPHEKRWFKCQITVLKDPEGAMEGAVIMHTNITEQILREMNLKSQLAGHTGAVAEDES